LRERRAAQEGDEVLAEIERRQLGQRERLGQALLVAVDEAPDLAAVLLVVIERKAGFLQRLDVAADRALGDAVLGRHVRRGRVTPGLDALQDLPLANDFRVAQAPPLFLSV